MDWIEVKPVIIKDTWKVRFKRATGYMPRPKPIKIHPDKAKKKVMIKQLYNAGWGSKMLSLWFREKQINISRWAKMPTPDRLVEFEQNFAAAMMDYDANALYKTKERMMEVIPQEGDLNKLVKAAEFFKGGGIKNQTNVQNIYGDLVKKYAPEGIEEGK